MAAIDRSQQCAANLARLNGHDLPRNWKRVGYVRSNRCRLCGMEFRVEGYRSAYGVSATISDNVDEKCSGTNLSTITSI